MQKDFSTNFTGWMFLAAAVMFWGGWMLLPVKIGIFFQPEDFAAVHESWHLWIWMFRVYLFGMVVSGIAVVALASLLTRSPARVMVWPGAAVTLAGMIVSALGAAFYYHHGAWGAEDMNGKSPAEIRAFVEALRIDSEYASCLVRFGRVFPGLGVLVIGCGLIRWNVLPAWLGWLAVAIGLAAMGLTMLLPDRLSAYLPVFHIEALWLALMGGFILRGGVRVEDSGG